jgi:hypothetical protein
MVDRDLVPRLDVENKDLSAEPELFFFRGKARVPLSEKVQNSSWYLSHHLGLADGTNVPLFSSKRH